MKNRYNFSNAKRGAVISKDIIVETAEQDLVDTFQLEVIEILYSIDAQESFVTDLSKISDFIEINFFDDISFFNKQKEEEIISIINLLFDNNINVLRSDKIADVARQLYFYKKSKTIN